MIINGAKGVISMKGIIAIRQEIHSYFADWSEEKKKRVRERVAEVILMVSTLFLTGFVLFFVLKAFLNYMITP